MNKKYTISFIGRNGETSSKQLSERSKAYDFIAKTLEFRDVEVEDIFRNRPYYTTYVCNDGSRFVLRKNY